MHFIDVGFKQSGSSANNNCYFETIFYGLNDDLEEINLYKWQEMHRGIGIFSEESVLNTLNSDECDELLTLIKLKKEKYSIDLDYSFIEKLNNDYVKIRKGV